MGDAQDADDAAAWLPLADAVLKARQSLRTMGTPRNHCHPTQHYRALVAAGRRRTPRAAQRAGAVRHHGPAGSGLLDRARRLAYGPKGACAVPQQRAGGGEKRCRRVRAPRAGSQAGLGARAPRDGTLHVSGVCVATDTVATQTPKKVSAKRAASHTHPQPRRAGYVTLVCHHLALLTVHSPPTSLVPVRASVRAPVLPAHPSLPGESVSS